MKKALYGRSVHTTVTCPNEACEKDIPVVFTPELKAKTYGPPERCYEGEPAEIDAPANCPHCGTEILEEDEERWLEEMEEEEGDNPFQVDRYDDGE